VLGDNWPRELWICPESPAKPLGFVGLRESVLSLTAPIPAGRGSWVEKRVQNTCAASVRYLRPLALLPHQYRIIESQRLEKTSKIITSNRHPNTTMPAKPCPQVPHLHVFLNSTTSSLFQHLTTLSVREFFLVSSLIKIIYNISVELGTN